jgi:copper resistance protein D
VALILASGLLSAGLRMQGFANLLQTTYGNVLLCKIALFAVLLALAAANRFVFLARLRRPRPGGSTSFHALSRSVLLD